MRKTMIGALAVALQLPALAMLHNLAWPWGNPPRCSPPQSPLFAFYNRANTTMLFDSGETIELFCQSQVRTAAGLSWTLHHNMVNLPFAQGEGEDLPANLFRIVIPTKGLKPGFYDLKVRLEGLGYPKLEMFARKSRDGKDVKVDKTDPVGQCTFGWKVDEMALPAPSYRPGDFRAFWDKAYGDYCRSVPLDARIESPARTFGAKAVETYNVTNACLPPCFDPKGIRHDEVVAYKVSWAGPDGGRVYANLARPAKHGKYPAMLVLPGAGTGPRPLPLDHARHGYVAIDVQVHGLDTGITNGYRIAGYPGGGPSPWKDVAREHSCWYPIYLRAARGVDYLASLDFVDAKKIVTVGGSQGGRLSVVVPAIDRRVAATVPAIQHGSHGPYLWWFKRMNGFARGEQENRPDPSIVKSDGHADYVRSNDEVDDPEFQRYRYFDPLNFAPDVTCPVLMNMGLLDPCSFAQGLYATYLRLGSAEKKLVPIAGHAHDWFPAFDRAAYRWLDRILDLL